MNDFCSSILVPQDIYKRLTATPANMNEWVKDGSITILTEWRFAVERAEVYGYDALSKEQKFAFSFEKCQIPGKCFPDEVKAGRLNADESYSFLVFNFPVYPSPDNHDFMMLAEILMRFSIVEVKGVPLLDFWIEPSLDDECNKWLDDRPDNALYNYSFVLLNAFHYIQTRMLRDKQRIERFQTKEVERQTREPEDPGEPKKNQPPRKIKIGCIQYSYLPVMDPEKAARSFTRHVEAWNVRGHYRKYRSGKRIWIRPYTKGKGKIKATEYVVE